MTRTRSIGFLVLCVAAGGMLSACGTNSPMSEWHAPYIRGAESELAAVEHTAIMGEPDLQGFREGSLHRPAVAAAKPVKSAKLAEDLWIIEATGAAERTPCFGTLQGKKGDEKRDSFEFRRGAVRPTITGTVATVQITQEFANASSERVDAEYLLALPADATPSDFLMTIGQRRVRAIVRDRASAEKLYLAAKGQGLPVTYAKAGSPLSIAVGNIDAGRDVTVTLQYIQPLAVKDGVCTFALGTSGLAKGKSAPTEGASLDVTANAGMTIERAEASHEMRIESARSQRYQGRLDVGAKDYVLSLQLSGKEPKGTVMSCRDSQGVYYAVNVVAPADRAVGGLVLSSRELGEVKLPDVGKGKAILMVGRVVSSRELRDPPVLTWGGQNASIALTHQTCAALPFLWARAQHDGMDGDQKGRMRVALEHGLLTEETAVLAVDTAQR